MILSSPRALPPANNFGVTGLTAEQVLKARDQYGSNVLVYRQKNPLWKAIKGLAGEPMVLLLLIASIIYSANGATGDAVFMIASIILISAISLYQGKKSRNALKKLEQFNQPLCKVTRGGTTNMLNVEELVIGDCIIAEERVMIPADGNIIHSNDFSVNESALTGESLPGL